MSTAILGLDTHSNPAAVLGPSTDEGTSRHALQCMEIWGGNHAANSCVTTPGLDLWVYSRPYADAVSGGDVHYLSLCGGGIFTRLVLADVSGHGALVADVACGLRDLVRRHINRKSQAKLVIELNRKFTRSATAGSFATAAVATYQATTNKLVVCNAGHPRPLWYRAENRHWSVLSGEGYACCGALSNLPLGLDKTSCYHESELALRPGDLVLFYTDAVTEAADLTGHPLGEAGLVDLVQRLDGTEPAQFSGRLVQR